MRNRLVALALLLGALVTAEGCSVLAAVGDTAVTFRVENRLTEPINVLTRYDDEPSFEWDFTLKPQETHDTTIMTHSTGISIRATDTHSKVLYEKHFAWEDPNLRHGERIDIVIQP